MTTWAGQQLISLAGASRRRLLVLMMVLVAGLTALISVNGAVAALLPVVVVMAVRLNQFPSRRLLPERTVRVLPPDLSRHAHTLAEEYLLQDGVFWLRVRPGSPYVGRQQAALDRRHSI